MTTTTTMNNVAANQANVQAAKRMNNIFDRKDIKGSISRLAKMGSGVFKQITADIHDLSDMTDDQVRETVTQTFNTAREKLQADVKMLNSIPTFNMQAKDFEDAAKTFLTVEKEILDIKDISVIRKALLMFWSGVKYIAGLIYRSCIAAGKFVATYGLRIIAVGIDFVIKVVKKTAGIFKTVWKTIKAVKVTSSGKEQEINPDDTDSFENGEGI